MAELTGPISQSQLKAPILPAGTKVPNPLQIDPTWKQLLCQDFVKCLVSLAFSVSVDILNSLITLMRLFQAWLELQIALLNIKIKFLEPIIAFVQAQLALVQGYIDQANGFVDKLPISIVSNCPPLQRLVTLATDFLKGPFKIPFTKLLVDPNELIQDLQELLSLRTELNLVKEILLSKIRELGMIIDALEQLIILIQQNLSLVDFNKMCE